MWYFTWMLGVLFACACGIINVLWLEHEHLLDEPRGSDHNAVNQTPKTERV